MQINDKELDKYSHYKQLVKDINDRVLHETGHQPVAFTRTYGCQQNVSDTEHINGMLSEMGYEFTDDEKLADIVIYNTCAVREHAQHRVFGNVGALKVIKENRPSMIIALCGCMTQQEHVAKKIKQSYPYVDLVFGTHALEKLPEMLYSAVLGRHVFELGGGDGVIEGLPVLRDGTSKVWLPVMYGCNNFCTYCIVPYVRGRERSRAPEIVIDEAKKLAFDGAHEITLLGQNVNSYGKDLGDKNFAFLLREINEIDGDFRIRFMTSHPKDASAELIDVMAQSEKVSKHLHLPFQSGSNKILRAMNRGYTKEQYLSLIDMIKEKIPNISLTSDIIVGFPGESYEDFKETLDVARRVEFDNLFTFIYSKREGTPAEKLDDLVPHEEKVKWLSELLALQEKIMIARLSAYIGRTVRVLCDNYNGNYVLGRTDSNILVRLTGTSELVGTFVDVKITESHRSMIAGILVD